MNEKGLFFDGASADVIPITAIQGKKAYDGRLEDLILRKCATVEKTLKLLEIYAFNSVQGQWLFADRTGDSVIIEAGDVIVRKKRQLPAYDEFPAIESRGRERALPAIYARVAVTRG